MLPRVSAVQSQDVESGKGTDVGVRGCMGIDVSIILFLDFERERGV